MFPRSDKKKAPFATREKRWKAASLKKGPHFAIIEKINKRDEAGISSEPVATFF